MSQPVRGNQPYANLKTLRLTVEASKDDMVEVEQRRNGRFANHLIYLIDFLVESQILQTFALSRAQSWGPKCLSLRTSAVILRTVVSAATEPARLEVYTLCSIRDLELEGLLIFDFRNLLRLVEATSSTLERLRIVNEGIGGPKNAEKRIREAHGGRNLAVEGNFSEKLIQISTSPSPDGSDQVC